MQRVLQCVLSCNVCIALSQPKPLLIGSLKEAFYGIFCFMKVGPPAGMSPVRCSRAEIQSLVTLGTVYLLQNLVAEDIEG